MRSILLLTLFLIPLFGFASFPIQTTTPSDTIIESKKETMEEYKIRIQKQLYSSDNDLYYDSRKKEKKNNYKSLFKILDSFFLVLGIISIIIATQVANNSTQFLAGLGWLYVGILSLGLSILIFLFKEIRNLFKKKQKIN